MTEYLNQKELIRLDPKLILLLATAAIAVGSIFMIKDNTVSVKDLDRATELGGADLTNYDCPDEEISCNKGGHKERSKKNDPNHLDFWKKIENQWRPKP